MMKIYILTDSVCNKGKVSTDEYWITNGTDLVFLGYAFKQEPLEKLCPLLNIPIILLQDIRQVEFIKIMKAEGYKIP